MDAKTSEKHVVFSYRCVFDGFDFTNYLFFDSLWRENK